MKKFLLIIMCFLFMGVVNARTLSHEDVIDGFLNSSLIKEINNSGETSEVVAVSDNTTNQSFDVTVGGTPYNSYSYAEGYIHYSDDSTITAENAEAQLKDFIFLSMFAEGIMTKSGVDVTRLNKTPDNFVFNFDTYNIYVESEPYNFTVDNVTLKGDYIRDYKLGFDTEKINAYANTVGYKEETTTTDKVPTIKIVSKDKKTVSLSVYVEDSDTTKKYQCNIYRSENKTSGFVSVFDNPFDCNDKNAIIIDGDLKENTTYYYKASVVGGTTESTVYEVILGNTNNNTNNNVVNPKTGTNQFIPLLIGFLVSIGALFFFHKNSGIKL